jgi:hypothetical protein
MIQKLYDLLPDFPKTEMFSEIHFYLKYSHFDLIKIVVTIDKLLELDFQQPYSFKELREEFPYILYGRLDFIIYFRIAQSLINLGQTVSKSALVELGQDLIHQGDLWNESSKSPPLDETLDNSEGVIKQLRNLAAEIREIIKKLEEIAQYRVGNGEGFDLLENSLKELANKFTQSIIPCAEDIYMQAWGLHRREYPEEAKEEDYWKMIETPLHEDYHPSALELDACPRCGAILTREDVYGHSDDEERGKYCESCRSRWIQASTES